MASQMMNLQEFVTESIKQIIDGVSAAVEYAEDKNAYVNVPLYTRYEDLLIAKDSLPNPSTIDFDVAVTTTDDKALKGGMGIFVAGLGIGYRAEKDASGSEVSRIKFSIPVVLPSQVKPPPKAEVGIKGMNR